MRSKALGNMLPQGKTILTAQGLTKKVVELLESPCVTVQSAAIDCLVQLITVSSPTYALYKFEQLCFKIYIFVCIGLEMLIW